MIFAPATTKLVWSSVFNPDKFGYMQVLNAAWDVSIPVASENALPCHDREGYNKILENAKPLNDPDGRHLSAFTYLRLSSVLMEKHNFTEFEQFVKRMHGKSSVTCPLPALQRTPFSGRIRFFFFPSNSLSQLYKSNFHLHRSSWR